MRNLKSTDLFAALRVVREIGIKDEVNRFAKIAQGSEASEELQRELGLELILGILANCGTESAEKAMYDFLSGPLEISVPELKDMDLEEFADTIRDFITSIDLEHWRGFFESLAALTMRQK